MTTSRPFSRPYSTASDEILSQFLTTRRSSFGSESEPSARASANLRIVRPVTAVKDKSRILSFGRTSKIVVANLSSMSRMLAMFSSVKSFNSSQFARNFRSEAFSKSPGQESRESVWRGGWNVSRRCSRASNVNQEESLTDKLCNAENFLEYSRSSNVIRWFLIEGPP